MMKNKIFGNGRKKLSLTDVLGFAWYAIVAMSMVHQGNVARFGGAMADMSIMIPMYAVAVLLLLAVVIRISFGKWQGVRRLYALIVAGVAVALSFGMTMRLETQFLLSAGLMNAMNVVFAAHAVWRTGRYDEAEAGYPKALAWTGNCVGYVALVALVLQVVELGVEYWAWVAKSGIVAAVVLCALVVTVLVAVSSFVNKNAVRKGYAETGSEACCAGKAGKMARIEAALREKGIVIKMIPISAKTGSGLPELTEALAGIGRRITGDTDETLVTNIRHYEALSRAATALGRVRDGLKVATLPPDLIAQDLREALYHLGEIVGEISTDEVLGNIFRKFCIGK